MKTPERKTKSWVLTIPADMSTDLTGMYAEFNAQGRFKFRHWLEELDDVWRFVADGWAELIALVSITRRHTSRFAITDAEDVDVDLDLLMDEVDRYEDLQERRGLVSD